MLSLLYIKRLRALQSTTSLTKIDNLTTKELYLIATLLANKYMIDDGEDEQLFNSELSELTGIRTERINLIERQVLLALNWDLHVSNDEYKRFFSLFKNHLSRKLDKQIEIEDPNNFYSLCFQCLPRIVEYLALTSLVLLGSTISILTAIHLSTITHSTLMKTLNPTHPSTCHWNAVEHERINMSRNEQIDYFNLNKPSWIFQFDFANETAEKYPSTNTYLNLPCCSIDLLRPHSLPRPFIHTFG